MPKCEIAQCRHQFLTRMLSALSVPYAHGNEHLKNGLKSSTKKFFYAQTQKETLLKIRLGPEMNP
jgi:hypothetical protein